MLIFANKTHFTTTTKITDDKPSSNKHSWIICNVKSNHKNGIKRVYKYADVNRFHQL